MLSRTCQLHMSDFCFSFSRPRLLQAETVRCLGCKRTIHQSTPGKQPAGGCGLCEDCQATEGAWAGAYLDLLRDSNLAEDRLAASQAFCTRCHSGGPSGAFLCDNGECPVLYARLASSARIGPLQQSLSRLDW